MFYSWRVATLTGQFLIDATALLNQANGYLAQAQGGNSDDLGLAFYNAGLAEGYSTFKCYDNNPYGYAAAANMQLSYAWYWYDEGSYPISQTYSASCTKRY